MQRASLQSAMDCIMVGNGNDVQCGVARYMVEERSHRGAPIGITRVHVKIRCRSSFDHPSHPRIPVRSFNLLYVRGNFK